MLHGFDDCTGDGESVDEIGRLLIVLLSLATVFLFCATEYDVLHNEIGVPCIFFEVERLDDEDEDEDMDCTTTAEPAAVDDDGVDGDEDLIHTVLLLPTQYEH